MNLGGLGRMIFAGLTGYATGPLRRVLGVPLKAFMTGFTLSLTNIRTQIQRTRQARA